MDKKAHQVVISAYIGDANQVVIGILYLGRGLQERPIWSLALKF